MQEKMYDVIIIGGGVTAFGAAMYCGRFQMKTLVVAGWQKGGVITTTDDVSNYPGFKKLTGIELAQKIEEHAREYEIEVMEEKADDVKKSGKAWEVSAGGKKLLAKTIIFATGSEVRKLGAPGEKELSNKGVSYCALCDGPLFKNKVLAVVGGGDSAIKEANLLAEYGSRVLVFARSTIKAEPVNYERAKKNPKMAIYTGVNVKEIRGAKNVESVLLDKPIEGKTEVKLDGVFIEIGHKPLSELAEKIGVQVNNKKEIVINRNSETNVAGVFAAGDVVDTRFKQAITGVAEGVSASYSAYQYVTQNVIS